MNKTFSGHVVSGRKIGRTIGFPTANILVEAPFQVTKGVYGVQITIKGIRYQGIMNVGTRPTFKHSDNGLSFEVHIFNFNQTIYNEFVEVELECFIRKERAFSSVNKLIEQIEQDISEVQHFCRVIEQPVF